VRELSSRAAALQQGLQTTQELSGQQPLRGARRSLRNQPNGRARERRCTLRRPPAGPPGRSTGGVITGTPHDTPRHRKP
jgi:hypothetical protein